LVGGIRPNQQHGDVEQVPEGPIQKGKEHHLMLAARGMCRSASHDRVFGTYRLTFGGGWPLHLLLKDRLFVRGHLVRRARCARSHGYQQQREPAP